jgi:hypothetical protein
MVIVNNFNYINKTSNHLSPQLTEYKKTIKYDVGNPGPGLGQAQKSGRVKPVDGITTLSS